MNSTRNDLSDDKHARKELFCPHSFSGGIPVVQRSCLPCVNLSIDIPVPRYFLLLGTGDPRSEQI